MATYETLLIPPESDEVALHLIEDITKNAKAVQENTLAQILELNAHTEYLTAYHLHQPTHKSEAFKSRVPIVDYDDLHPLIRRIADGDTSHILSAQPISQFYTSSGTSAGESKLFPTTKQSRDGFLVLYGLMDPILRRHVKGSVENPKGLYFLFTREVSKSNSGIPLMTATTSIYKSDYFNNRISKFITSPMETIYCTDTYQSTYAQMLCGIYDRRQVLLVGAAFAAGLVRIIRFLQHNWQLFEHDIRSGTLNPRITDASVRRCMERVMRPDPELADFIASECGSNVWEGIVTRIWPNTKSLRTIATGTMSQYIPTIDYYSGGLPIASMIYGSSECNIGINLNPMCNPSQVSYTIMPNMAYFEFLPHNPNSIGLSTHQQLIDLVNLEIDKEYEIVVTTYSGLNRYRVGDIIRVTGYYNSAPQVQFVRRKNVLLSIDAEKTDEWELQRAVEKASRLLGEFDTSVVDYTSCADNTTTPGHYVIYCELSMNDSHNISPSDQVLQQCCLEMEKSFNIFYRGFRCDESIGPLEIRVMKNGTFEEVMELSLSRGASVAQYKMPRCIRDQQLIRLLNSRVVSTNFSPSLPNVYRV